MGDTAENTTDNRTALVPEDHPVWEAVSDLVRLGLTFDEIQQRTTVRPEFLKALYDKLGLQVKLESNKRKAPVRQVVVAQRKPAKFADTSWIKDLVIELSSDDEDDGETYRTELEAKELQIRMMKRKIAELKSSLKAT